MIPLDRDPALPENAKSMTTPEAIDAQVIVEPAKQGWTLHRVYSQFTSREIFTDPQGVEWVRVSVTAFNPTRGDLKLAVKGRGMQPILLRRRDAFVENLRKGDL